MENFLYTTFLAAASPSGEETPLNLAPERAQEAAASGGGGSLARVIVGLAVVIAVIYGLSWVLKQVKASREGTATGAGLGALASLPLGPNRSVHLVRVGQELVLLGVAEGGVTPIRTYAEDEARAAGLIAGDGGEATARPVPAGALLQTLRDRTVRR
jgi:flagellar protein FliO/FliZ